LLLFLFPFRAQAHAETWAHMQMQLAGLK